MNINLYIPLLLVKRKVKLTLSLSLTKKAHLRK